MHRRSYRERHPPQRFITIPPLCQSKCYRPWAVVPMTRSVQDQVDALKRTLVYIAGVSSSFSRGGWILAGRALKPIDDITRRARQITAHDLSHDQRIRDDEVGRMASTFDDLIARLEEVLERQNASPLMHPTRVAHAAIGYAS